jgi:hypothetical protein
MFVPVFLPGRLAMIVVLVFAMLVTVILGVIARQPVRSVSRHPVFSAVPLHLNLNSISTHPM